MVLCKKMVSNLGTQREAKTILINSKLNRHLFNIDRKSTNNGRFYESVLIEVICGGSFLNQSILSTFNIARALSA